MSFGYQILGFGGGVGIGPYPSATGGSISTVSTNYKLHTFTADGQFIWTAGNDATYGNKVEFLLIGGGGGSLIGGIAGGNIADLLSGANRRRSIEQERVERTFAVTEFGLDIL